MSECHDPDSLLHDLNHGLAKCFERVDELELKLQLSSHNFEEFVKQNIDNILNHINNDKSGKKPHKCPVCDGKGKIIEKLASFVNFEETSIDCKACEGKGIVWG